MDSIKCTFHEAFNIVTPTWVEAKLLGGLASYIILFLLGGVDFRVPTRKEWEDRVGFSIGFPGYV